MVRGKSRKRSLSRVNTDLNNVHWIDTWIASVTHQQSVALLVCMQIGNLNSFLIELMETTGLEEEHVRGVWEFA